ncbi:uncharacterized protein B0T23DRAFT_394091 [Neurospora hispaniola]|uniref:Uncharacterized protein n=1 Tax=Neurospora hispaniola TaxID=588809 RepID=A0AAJ0IES1_9PEZI|nr:hypothetical protein B0T23DRAFT_394091 [Neurospora hispaniola]
MKLSTVAPFLLCSVHTALAQSLAPSPTASVGCEPHGDHWHCEGLKVTSLATVVTAASVSSVAATTSAVHDHDDHDGESGSSVSLKPSPTESYGCEAHGDHWHCAGHVSATTTTSPGSQEQAGSVNATASTTPPTAGAIRQGASGLAAAGLAIMALAF